MDDAESAVVDALVDAWNLFVRLPVLHVDDANDFRRAIHDAQRIIYARPELRAQAAARDRSASDSA